MRLPKDVVKEMQFCAASYNPVQKNWYKRNEGKIISLCEFVQFEEGIECSYFNGQYVPSKNGRETSGQWNGYRRKLPIVISQWNRSRSESSRELAETVFHEFGHLLYEGRNIKKFGKTMKEELKDFFEVNDSSDKESIKANAEKALEKNKWKHFPIMVNDSIVILFQVKIGRSHEIGYSEEHLETEIFAETFAAIMTNDSESLQIFETICPKTANIVKKEIEKVFK